MGFLAESYLQAGPLIPILPALVAGLASTAVGAIVAAETKPDDPPPLPTPEPPAQVGHEGQIAAQRMAEQRRRRTAQGGRASTIIGGKPLGDSSQAPAPTAKKFLTGA